VTDYSYTSSHQKEQWAWEFLRRNPEYQRDYKAFIHRWHTLENLFGKGAECNHQAWQNDIRSLANEWDNEMTLLEELPGAERDNTTQEPVQIDVWMQQKWGFECFPIDPMEQSAEVFEQIKWSEQKIDLDDIRFDAQTSDPIAQVNFDLRKNGWSRSSFWITKLCSIKAVRTHRTLLGKVVFLAIVKYC